MRLAAGLLAHRDPHVGVDGVRAGDGLARVASSRCSRPAGPRRARIDGSGRQPGGVAMRRFMPVSARGLDQRVRDVVAVADVGQRHAVEAAEVLAQRQQSASAWHGWWSSVSALMTGTAACSASSATSRWANVRIDDRLAVGREHAGGVGDRLAAAELELVGAQHDRQAAEPVDRRLERHARARGRLGEVARDGIAVEGARASRAGGASSRRRGRAARELRRVEVGDPQQVAARCVVRRRGMVMRGRHARSGRTCSAGRRGRGRARSRRS